MNASRTAALLLWILLALPAAATTKPIAGARALPLGTTVTIEGRVTVPSGVFSSASLEDQGFAIEDATGGVYVRLDVDLGIHRNQQVRVTGTLDQSFNILFVRAEPSGVQLLPSSPLLIATGEVGSATEGRIITVAGVITDIFDDGNFGVQFAVDDGSGPLAVFVHRSTGMDPFAIPFIGLGKKVQVTGFSSRFADEVELQPRFRDDIRPQP
jgi:DNA/RNA endonuclease YhcR with UshA esterase domain